MFLFISKLFLSYYTTLSAYSSSFIFQSVLCGKFMAENAMCFPLGYCAWRLASQYIFFLRYSLHMIRIYARSISTKMINGKAWRNFSFIQFVRKPMCKTHSSREVYPENSISCFHFCPSPLPTGMKRNKFNFAKKSFLYRPLLRSSFHAGGVTLICHK